VAANGTVSASGYTPLTPFSLDVYDGGRENPNVLGNTDVLVFHGSTDAPAVDVFESAVLNTTAVNDVSYGTYAGYLELPTDEHG
jgi:hypothetical protein